jgi:predicted neutral ceramidase superfamily lipid hydrolase
MPVVQKLRKWHFLLLGCTLVLIAAFLWYWDWRSLGIPSPLRAEHYITILTYVTGVFVLGLFVFRLSRKQDTIMLLALIVTNLLATLAITWIYRSYPAFFELLRQKTLESYDPLYIEQWGKYFLTPALIAIQSGLVLLWIEALVMFLVRKPTDNPE